MATSALRAESIRCHPRKIQRRIDRIAAAADHNAASLDEFDVLIAALDEFEGDADLEDYDVDLEEDQQDCCLAGDDWMSAGVRFPGQLGHGLEAKPEEAPAPRYGVDQTKPPLPIYSSAVWARFDSREAYIDPLKLRAAAERQARECRA